MKAMSQEITIAIMAGGESRRMGRDKALLPTEAGSLLERTARIASSTGCAVAIIGRSRPENWAIAGVSFHRDRYPGKGPLGGIATALEILKTDILALPCDLPLLTADAVAWLLDTWKTEGCAPGLVAVSDGRLEPLFAVYAQEFLPAVQDRIAAEQLSVNKLLTAAGFRTMAVPTGVADALTNVNTPEEWDRATKVKQND